MANPGREPGSHPQPSGDSSRPDPDRTPRSEGSPRRILLVDCDQFYVQVARLEDPEGAGAVDLLIVGGSATGRGVVTSASYAARAFGVRSAMPTVQALRLCPDATVVGVPREACSRRSADVKASLELLSPVVQAASIDEFYLDLTGTERLFQSETLEDTAWRIRETVEDETRISVSIGGGSTRLVAKLATRLAKPGGVHVVSTGREDAFMRQFSLADLPGIGPSLVEALRVRGLVSVEDALPVEEAWLQRWFGPTRGSWLYRRVRGVDASRVDPREPRKSVSSERTFARDLKSDGTLERELMKLSVSVGRHLRKGHLRARTVTVKLRDSDFRTRTASHTLPDAIESDGVIFSVAQDLLTELRRKRRTPARLLGVGLSNLTDRDAPDQLGLFRDEGVVETDRQRALAHTVDDLRGKFGDRAVIPGRIVRKET